MEHLRVQFLPRHVDDSDMPVEHLYVVALLSFEILSSSNVNKEADETSSTCTTSIHCVATAVRLDKFCTIADVAKNICEHVELTKR